MRYVNDTVLSGTVSGTTPIVGSTLDTNQQLQCSFQYVGGIGISGVMKVQISNTANPGGSYNDANAPTQTWSDLSGATSTITAGVGSPIVLTNMAFRWVRVVFTPSAGSTAMTIQRFSLGV